MSIAQHAETLASLLPPVALDAAAQAVRSELRAAASLLDGADSQTGLLLQEIDPRFTYNLLDLFEHDYGVPDHCSDLGLTVADRRLAILQKLVELGGQTPAYFERIAHAFGYDDASVREYLPWTCVDPCDAPVADSGWRNVWAVQTSMAERVTFFTCSSPCTEPLANWSFVEPLGCVLTRLKPAHTTCFIDLGI